MHQFSRGRITKKMPLFSLKAIPSFFCCKEVNISKLCDNALKMADPGQALTGL